jgi:hypothetical protein
LVKKLISDAMESYNYMNSKNFFRSKILKKHKEDIINYWSTRTKEAMRKKSLDNMKRISRASLMPSHI